MPNGEPFDPSLVLFAALAVFVVWKLRSVLGVKTDRETPAPGAIAPRGPSSVGAPPPGAVPLDGAPPNSRPAMADRWKGLAAVDSAAWAGLDAISAADPHFDGKAFVAGARRAYEIIVEAFAKGDSHALRNLLSEDVFDGFAKEIARREAAGETVETAVVAIDKAMIDAARATPQGAELTVRFETKLMTTRRDRDGEFIDGAHDRTERVVELWTFARDRRSNDANWRLVATQSAA